MEMGQYLLNQQCLLSMDSTFLVEHQYDCHEGALIIMDDERGLHRTTEPPDKGFYSEDELNSRGDEKVFNNSQELDSDADQRQEFSGVVDMVKDNSQASWKFWSIVHQIRSILNSLDFQIQHSYREGNTIADSLANQGVLARTSSTFSSSDSLPVTTRLLMLQGRRQIRNL
ncbi:unnamed protein product [Ilex paraguariensis]|uniref:RNase H type-1 domain-containing protein n=1 Tax=Ilex paraguariensis TaxID=185542 RepID=A0ABC8QRV0_9AQUA